MVKCSKYLCLSVFCAWTGAKAQQTQQDFSKFVPDTYKIVEKQYGDLNRDGLEDCVLLIRGTEKGLIVKDEYQGEVDHNRRGIIILFKKGRGYTPVVKNYDCFSSGNEDGGIYFPPQLSIGVQQGNLHIYYDHGRYGNWRYTLRYHNSDFELIGYDESDNEGPVVNSETSINFLTKRKKVKTNVNRASEGGDEVFEESWSDVKTGRLQKLSEIKNFEDPYEMIYTRL